MKNDNNLFLMLLTNLLKTSAQQFADKPALTMKMGYRTVSLTYAEVFEMAKKISVFLDQQGVKKGDKVLLLAPNSPYWICVFWATLLKGCVLIPLNTQSTSEMVDRVLEQTNGKIIFKHLYFQKSLSNDVPTFDIEMLPELTESISIQDFQEVDITEDDLVQIMYTSGTTGDPKGVPLTHKNVVSNMQGLAEVIQIPQKERFLSILPLSHILEQVGGFLVPFQSGCHIIYAHSPAKITELLQQWHISIMVAVPEFLRVVMGKIETKAEEKGKLAGFQKMLKRTESGFFKPFRRLIFRPIHKGFGGKLHTVVSGGAYLDPELEKKWECMGIRVLQGYGLTETSAVVSINTYDQHQFGSVGKKIPNIDFRIQDDNEIQVKGPNVFSGYYQNEKKTNECFSDDGWFMTGDLGEVDKKGFLHFKGRKKYVIVGAGGQNVYPEDIERELNTQEGVKDSCVLGLETDGGHTEIHAVLLLDPETKTDPDSLVSIANSKLASYQHIHKWSIWPDEDFPRSLTRKIQKTKVEAFIEENKEERPEQVTHVTPLIQMLADITHTDVSQIQATSKLASDLHLDSLLRVILVARIEEKFGAMLDESQITNQTTVEELDTMIHEKKELHLPYRVTEWMLSWWARFLRSFMHICIVWPLSKCMMKLEVKGLDHLKDLQQPFVIMPNHISPLDGMAVIMALPSSIRKRTAIAAAVDALYTEYKKYSKLVELAFNTFPLPRKEGQHMRFGMEYVGHRLDQEYNIMIFPEGQMSKDRTLQPLKKGAGFIGVEMRVPIVPVKITGTQDVIPYHRIIPVKRGKVTVEFGKPITFSRSDSYNEVTEKIEKALSEM